MEVEIRCIKCGWTGVESDLKRVSYYEDYGDVSTVACPKCGRIVYDGMEIEDLFREI